MGLSLEALKLPPVEVISWSWFQVQGKAEEGPGAYSSYFCRGILIYFCVLHWSSRKPRKPDATDTGDILEQSGVVFRLWICVKFVLPLLRRSISDLDPSIVTMTFSFHGRLYYASHISAYFQKRLGQDPDLRGISKKDLGHDLGDTG